MKRTYKDDNAERVAMQSVHNNGLSIHYYKKAFLALIVSSAGHTFIITRFTGSSTDRRFSSSFLPLG
jgi:hypothetical protein